MAVLKTPAGIAFFDLDRTILSINSASCWIRRELREGYLGRLVAVKGAVYIGMVQPQAWAMTRSISSQVGAGWAG